MYNCANDKVIVLNNLKKKNLAYTVKEMSRTVGHTVPDISVREQRAWA